MSRPTLLDLFCGAGGAAVGYKRAGFDVTGVDIAPQPRYPFAFIQADALAYLAEHGHEFDAIHASPPCQSYTALRSLHPERTYPDLVAATRAGLVASGRPWVIENVVGAPVRTVILLCGSMFGLNVRRHRLFESSHLLLAPHCNHTVQRPRFRCVDKRRGGLLSSVIDVSGHVRFAGEQALRETAMGITWMTPTELTQAIPPAYCEFIGSHLRQVLV